MSSKIEAINELVKNLLILTNDKNNSNLPEATEPPSKPKKERKPKEETIPLVVATVMDESPSKPKKEKKPKEETIPLVVATVMDESPSKPKKEKKPKEEDISESSSDDLNIKKDGKKKNQISATIKKLVWNTHIGEEIGKAKCLCCKCTYITQLSFHCGHVISEANGGETIVSNLKPICQNCNSSMNTKNMNDFMKTLR